MNVPSLLKRPPLSSAHESLESVIDAIASFGAPTLTVVKGRGWWCRVEMTTTAVGTDFTVKSESNHQTAIAAAIECLDRVRKAMKEVRS